MAESKIEWTDRSDWNPIRGCTRVSPGCGGPGDFGGCYAEAMAARFSDPGQWGHGFAERTAKGGRWTGEIAIQWDRIELPLRWRKPSYIFASSTSDFFHKDLLWHDVAHLFGVMIAAHHLHGHTFQVLTKRADIMCERLNDPEFWIVANSFANGYVMERVDPLNRRSDDARATLDDYGPESPPPGIWLGVSVEDQQRADERVSNFRNTPAAVHFVSYEPALGPVDWSGWGFVDQIIGGGESGPKARPAHPDWFRNTRDWCADFGVDYFHKQNGEWVSVYDRDRDDPEWNKVPKPGDWDRKRWLNLAGGQGFHGDKLNMMLKVGKKAAGRLLDGVEHNGMPQVLA